MYFWQKTEGVILNDGNIDSKKTESRYENHSPSLCEPSTTLSFEKNQLQVKKKIRKFSFFSSFICSKKPERKKYDVTYSLKRSL